LNRKLPEIPSTTKFLSWTEISPTTDFDAITCTYVDRIESEEGELQSKMAENSGNSCRYFRAVFENSRGEFEALIEISVEYPLRAPKYKLKTLKNSLKKKFSRFRENKMRSACT